MKIRIFKYSKLARFLKVGGIVIYPFIFFADPDPGRELINHEMIHINQIKQLGVVKFYSLYFKEYLHNRVKGMSHNQAYLAISFEKEAYENQDKLS
ncbi:MAG: hypothetical protein H7177_02005 [Rhizobacter sp.]|nr:hypothetical protein [Bacteriovorax sp.]